MTTEHTNTEPIDGDVARDAIRAAMGRIDRVNEWLHLGSALPPDDYERLRDAGITHVVDLREDDDGAAAQLSELGIVWRHVPVPNRAAPTTGQLEDVAAWITARDGQERIYVHCAGGFGRAGTMAVGLLVDQRLSVADAEEQVRAVRPEIRINEAQRSWLEALEAQRKTDTTGEAN